LKRVLFIVMDGWGLSPLKEGNATYLAKTPNLDWVYGNYPKTAISASGIDVGVSANEVGNSEVGHLNLGSGRVVWENMPRIDQEIEKGDFFRNQNLVKIAKEIKTSGGSLHLVGLCSKGGVHSSLNHLFAFLRFVKDQGMQKVFIHVITDGRDTAPQVAKEDISLIEAKTAELGVGKIATIIGRYFAMDRDKHFERVEKAYNLWTLGKGEEFSDPIEAVEKNYQSGADDEKIEACLIDKDGLIKSADGVILFNFRSDRMRQILEVFESDNFSGFARQKIKNLSLLSMTKYFDGQIARLIFPPLDMTDVLADIIESAGLSQCHIAETEKYAHVSYFFNGGEEKPHAHEEQILVPSPRVESYDQLPEMSAFAVKDKVVEAIKKNYQFILVNFANGDMVGHTGNLDATVKAVEAVDRCLFEILSAASPEGITAIITADHGNCEIMINPANNEINKEHTSSPVPFVIIDLAQKPFTPQSGNYFDHEALIEYSGNPPSGILADAAPTILQILGLSKPEEMSGTNISNLI